jgi:hypothetical protein
VFLQQLANARLALVALLAFSLLGGHGLLALVHRAAVRHVTCPEHGELLHVADGLAKPQGQPVDAMGRRSQARPHTHHSCPICTAPDRPLTEVETIDLGQPIPAPAQQTLPAAAPTVAVDYRLAPKQSPPS